uniref:SFRICE_038250 n=1 Tax=Spodoptera frugiperda TaxID=7108 RepID=A0A2H1V2Q7_SPOFR
MLFSMSMLFSWSIDSEMPTTVHFSVLMCEAELLEHRRKVASLSVFYRIHFGEYAGELHNFIPPSPFHLRTTRQSARRHRFMVDIPLARSASLQASLCELLGSRTPCRSLCFLMGITWVSSKPEPHHHLPSGEIAAKRRPIKSKKKEKITTSEHGNRKFFRRGV